MANDQAVVFAAGFLEGYINICQSKGIENSEAAQVYLKTIMEGYHEYRKNIGIYQRFLAKLRDTINSVT
jgi:hypothetical protein